MQAKTSVYMKYFYSQLIGIKGIAILPIKKMEK